MLYKQIRRDAGTQKNRKILCFVTLKCFRIIFVSDIKIRTADSPQSLTKISPAKKYPPRRSTQGILGLN